MFRVRSMAVCIVALVLFSQSSAMAGDDWTGLYFGGQLGAGKLGATRESTFARTSNFNSRDTGYSEHYGGPNGVERHDFVTLRTIDEVSRYEAFGGDGGESGPTAGVLFGGNWRVGSIVLGAELNFDWADLLNKATVDFSSTYLQTHTAVQSTDGGPYLPLQNDKTSNVDRGQASYRMNLDWKASAIVRAGTLLSERALFYGLIGYTRAGFTESPFSTRDGFTTPFDSRDGITFGAGVEASMGNGWFLRAEYRRTELEAWTDKQSETATYTGASYTQIVGSASRSQIDASIDEVRGALTYRFTGLGQ